MSGQRRQCDLLSDWATVELCEAQAAHRGSGMGDFGFPSPPAEVKPGAEPGCGGLCHGLGPLWATPGVWHGTARHGTQPHGSVQTWQRAYVGGSGQAQFTP